VPGTAMRRVRILTLVAFLAGAPWACGPGQEMSEEEAYSVVLAEAAARLDLTPPILVHPFKARVDRTVGGNQYAMRDFLAFDTAEIHAAVRRDPGTYRVCELTPAGACLAPLHGQWVVLSEVLDEGRNGGLVLVMVSDRRSAVRPQRFYAVRLKSGSVVRFEPVE